jgi:hypothetical protein
MKTKIMMSLIAIVFLWAGFTGCASLHKDTSPSRESESLGQAVERYYTYIKVRDFMQAFQYERMSLQEEIDPQYYAGRSAGSGIILYDFQILEIGEEGKGQDGYTAVKIKLITSWPQNLDMNLPDFDRELTFDDMWTKIEGKWYHVVQGLSRDW